MGTIRYAIIIGALFAVLLSAFRVERRVCAADVPACATAAALPVLPLSRILIALRERQRTEARAVHPAPDM